MIEVVNEKMNDVFDKYHINGLPFPLVLHKFTSTVGENAHDHPFSFTTFILNGGYIERIYTIDNDGNWKTEDVYRKPGTVNFVNSTCIHELIELPEGECWTAIIPGPWERETKFWQFKEDGVYYRNWNESEFTELKREMNGQ